MAFSGMINVKTGQLTLGGQFEAYKRGQLERNIQYIQEISGEQFSSKDFRTWSGSISTITICNLQGSCEAQNAKQKTNEILDEVAKHLGNTRNVCRKYYVHPSILELYQKNKLNKYLKELNKPINTKNKSGYTPEENVLMKILKSNSKTAYTIKV